MPQEPSFSSAATMPSRKVKAKPAAAADTNDTLLNLAIVETAGVDDKQRRISSIFPKTITTRTLRSSENPSSDDDVEVVDIEDEASDIGRLGVL